MSTPGPPPPLAERLDIHKSCRSIEILLSVFNDYCEATGSVVTLQKKMTKALRDTAGLKVTGEVAANALNATATIFEALSEIDSKFSKVADKEYDGVSNDVKKWFKKLAKEEKAHDERIAIANAKIKQAGLTFEKKSKKSARDASEEHARYINLISAIGPEISQEKYNHSLQVTMRHTTTTYNVAASVSRLADAEWLRSCENVRRFAPSIGSLIQWRTYCEGGWTGSIPTNLKDIDDLQPPSPVDEGPSTSKQYVIEDNNVPQIIGKAEAIPPNNVPSAETHATEISSPSFTPNDFQPQNQPFPSPVLTQAQSLYQNRQIQNAQQSTSPSSFDPPRKFTDSDNTGSVRSLSQFPAPPTHFPLPPPLPQRQSSGSSSPATSLPPLNTNRLERQFERQPLGSEDTLDNSATASDSPMAERHEVVAQTPKQPESPQTQSLQQIQSEEGSSERKILTSDTHRDQSSLSPTQSKESYSSKSRGDYIMDTKTEQNITAQSNEEVTRTGSNGSIVAAMRSRYSYTPRSAPSPPKDPPHLPLSVNDLATRYQSPGSPSSPRSRPLSPNGSRPLRSLEALRQGEVVRDQPSPSISSASRSNTSETSADDKGRRHQQRLNQLTMQDRERELRLKEKEIELRSQELEREKAMLFSRNEVVFAREPSELDSIARNPQPPLRLRDRHLSFQQPQKLTTHHSDATSAPFTGRPLSQYSYASTTNLAPPPLSSYGSSDAGSTSARRDSSQNSSTGTSNHAPYCGCENCSASKYKTSSPLPSPVRSEKEKPKGWIRRLSMPIVAGNVFLDSKKNKDTGYGIGKGVRSLDSKKNASTTGLRTGISEEGRFGAVPGRRSYDAGGVSNRSMTNLGMNA